MGQHAIVYGEQIRQVCRCIGDGYLNLECETFATGKLAMCIKHVASGDTVYVETACGLGTSADPAAPYGTLAAIRGTSNDEHITTFNGFGTAVDCGFESEAAVDLRLVDFATCGAPLTDLISTLIGPWNSGWEFGMRIDGGGGADEVRGSPQNDLLFASNITSGFLPPPFPGGVSIPIGVDDLAEDLVCGRSGDDFVYGDRGDDGLPESVDILSGGNGFDECVGSNSLFPGVGPTSDWSVSNPSTCNVEAPPLLNSVGGEAAVCLDQPTRYYPLIPSPL